jgi:hypothetical protein
MVVSSLVRRRAPKAPGEGGLRTENEAGTDDEAKEVPACLRKSPDVLWQMCGAPSGFANARVEL